MLILTLQSLTVMADFDQYSQSGNRPFQSDGDLQTADNDTDESITGSQSSGEDESYVCHHCKHCNGCCHAFTTTSPGVVEIVVLSQKVPLYPVAADTGYPSPLFRPPKA